MRGHVGITQNVGLTLQILQTVLYDITDADDTDEIAVAQQGCNIRAFPASIRLDAHKLHHLAPFLGLFHDELAEVAG
jgi:hypothetical protein